MSVPSARKLLYLERNDTIKKGINQSVNNVIVVHVTAMGKIIKTAGESGGAADNRNGVAGKKSKKRLKKELKKAAKKAKLEPSNDSNNEAENSIEPALDQEEEAEEDLEEGEVSSVIAAGIINEGKLGGFDAEVAKILAKANQLVAQDGENKIPSLHLNLETFSRGLVSIEVLSLI